MTFCNVYLIDWFWVC